MYAEHTNDGLIHIKISEKEKYGVTLLVKQLSTHGVTGTQKAADQKVWVAKMNSIHHRASEIVYQELIYQ